MAHLLDLLKLESHTIAVALDGRQYFMVEENEATCRIVADDLIVRLGWDNRDQLMSSSIKPSVAPKIFTEVDPEMETELLLRITQENWSEQKRPIGPMSRSLVAFELGLVRDAVAKVFSDPARVREALIYAVGFYEGYTQRGHEYQRP